MSHDNWYLMQRGQQSGPVSADTIREMVASSRVLPTDLGWRQGMPQWFPLHLLPDLIQASSDGPQPPPLPPQALSYVLPPRYGPPQDPGENPTMRMLMPVGRSGWAIAAGYLGLFSVLLFPAPVAIGAAIYAISDIKKNPKHHGMGRAIFGLIMGILGTIVLIIIAIAAFK
jgi:hypothetical protein